MRPHNTLAFLVGLLLALVLLLPSFASAAWVLNGTRAHLGTTNMTTVDCVRNLFGTRTSTAPGSYWTDNPACGAGLQKQWSYNSAGTHRLQNDGTMYGSGTYYPALAVYSCIPPADPSTRYECRDAPGGGKECHKIYWDQALTCGWVDEIVTLVECDAHGVVCSNDPEHCTDGWRTPGTDEEGLDCGGSCSAPCVEFCPGGWVMYYDTWTEKDACYDPNKSVETIEGKCPMKTWYSDPWQLSYVKIDDRCYEAAGTKLAYAGWPDDFPDEQDAEPYLNPWDKVLSSEDTTTTTTTTINPQGETVETTITTTDGVDHAGYDYTKRTTVETTTHGDGSSTIVTTVYNSHDGPGGPGSTTTTTTTHKDGEGNTTGETTSTETSGTDSEGEAEDKPEDSPVADALPDAVDYDSAFAGVGDGLKSRFDQMVATVEATSIFGMADGLPTSNLSGGSSALMIDFGSYGQKGIELSRYDGAFAIIRILLLCVMCFVSLRIIFLKG